MRNTSERAAVLAEDDHKTATVVLTSAYSPRETRLPVRSCSIGVRFAACYLTRGHCASLSEVRVEDPDRHVLARWQRSYDGRNFTGWHEVAP